jgi:hypothetical protein
VGFNHEARQTVVRMVALEIRVQSSAHSHEGLDLAGSVVEGPKWRHYSRRARARGVLLQENNRAS